MSDNITINGVTVATSNTNNVHTPRHLEDTTQRAALVAVLNALATAAGQTTIISHVDGIEGLLTSLLAKVIAAPATEAKQDTLNTYVDGIETSLTSILAKIIASPSTEATLALAKTALDLINTNLGAVTASPSANTVLARLKDIATAVAAPVTGNFDVSDPAEDLSGNPTSLPLVYDTFFDDNTPPHQITVTGLIGGVSTSFRQTLSYYSSGNLQSATRWIQQP